MADKDTKLIPAEELSWTAALAMPSRREFLGASLTAAAGVALLPLLRLQAQQTGNFCVAKTGAELMPVGEISSGTSGLLQGLIDLQVENRGITYYGNGIYNCTMHTLRAYHGYRGYSLDPKNRVTQVGIASPGPTLRCRVGDTIALIFLNRLDKSKFPSTSVTSSFGKCDTARNLTGKEVYPGKDAANFPNCFHASNTTNLHFHGTHTTPNGFGDNVLVGVIPDPKMDVAAVMRMCTASYESWAAGLNPTAALQAAAAKALSALLKAAREQNDTELVQQIESGVNANAGDAAGGEWPQYWPGFYPYYFQLPVYSGDPKVFPRMGQAPGTHWYHCHQHGSTSLQLLNGMAGVLLITGEYDDKILSLGGGTPANPKIKEQLMIFQFFAEEPNLVNGSPSAAFVAVNGQVFPTITMKKGEVQWWRIANAILKAHGIDEYLLLDDATYQDLVKNPAKMKGPDGRTAPPPTVDPTKVPLLNQTAQDGVQLEWTNYGLLSNLTSFKLSPGNRADFLVKATASEGTMYFVFWPATGTGAIRDIRANTILKVVVKGDSTTENTSLPTEKQYPPLPPYLVDITDKEINGRARTVTFSMDGGPGSQPFFYIDGKQFSEGIVDQAMLEDTAEEWTLANTSLNAITHPFHIHINPFQVTEVFDPATMKTPLKLPPPWIWWDVIGIPAGVQQTGADGKPAVDKDGKPIVTPGHIKMRSRFVDYAGKFVLHCHILGHEDRGMMQLIEVVSNKTVVKHH